MYGKRGRLMQRRSRECKRTILGGIEVILVKILTSKLSKNSFHRSDMVTVRLLSTRRKFEANLRWHECLFQATIPIQNDRKVVYVNRWRCGCQLWVFFTARWKDQNNTCSDFHPDSKLANHYTANIMNWSWEDLKHAEDQALPADHTQLLKIFSTQPFVVA